VLVVLDEIPEDAAFAIRALCLGDAPRIEIAQDSPLQTRAFHKPLARFTLAVKLRYYSLRYLIGIIGFLAIFAGGLWLTNQEMTSEDWILVWVVMIVAGLSFVLVVPYQGKTTIVGYLTSTETDQFWGDRTGASGGLPKSE
jgi:cytochrome bd-type quinol oxidase subunit 1